jgi:nicotinamidase-related amidase
VAHPRPDAEVADPLDTPAHEQTTQEVWMSNALLVLDYQEGFCREGSTIGGPTGIGAHVASRAVLANARTALEAARGASYVIAHSRVAFLPGYSNRTNRSQAFSDFEANGLMSADSADAQICSEVAPAGTEPVFLRGWVNPFLGTSLPGLLQANAVTRVFVMGVATNFVVESAARHAGDAGFDVTVIEDACATYTPEMQQFAVESILPTFGRITTAGEFAASLKS